MEYRFKRMASPVGLLTLAAKGDKLTAILWECEIDGRVPLGDMTEDPAFLEIPFGETRSYGDIARRIGRPKAVRAVGAANGRNPISIVAPCHRVIGASGKLTGFAGGLDNKALLLKLEGRKS